jgi:hypothetical protein
LVKAAVRSSWVTRTDSPLIYPVLLGACALSVEYAGWMDVVSLYLRSLVHWHVRGRSDCVTMS